MKDALQALVRGEEYQRFEFEDDLFASYIESTALWTLMTRVVKAAGSVLLLLRLTDSNNATLSKVRGTVDHIKKLMVDGGKDTLEDQIDVSFHNRAPELDCDIASAAYVLDQQFVRKSRNADANTMTAFWRVARAVLRIEDDVTWRQVRQQIVGELAKFRMRTGGFNLEDYDMMDTCAFWGAAGCHAPLLKKLAFALMSLPCSSGETERNWLEVREK